MVTTAGSFSRSVSWPPSTSRVTIAVLPSMTSFDANVPCGQPRSAASIWPVWLASSSIACLPRMTSPGCSAATIALRSFATASGSTALLDLDQDAAVGAHGEAGAERLGRLRRPDRDHHDLARLAGFLLPQRLLDGDLVERVHRHLDVGEVDAGPVRLDAHLDVEIDDPFDGDQYLHRGGRSVPGFRAAGADPRVGGISPVNILRRWPSSPGSRSRAPVEERHAAAAQEEDEDRAGSEPADMRPPRDLARRRTSAKTE